jgi:hypothetical protein
MARIRTIKPEYWSDEKVGRLSMQARLLFIGLLNFSDDTGVVRGHPIYLRSMIFPYDDISKQEISNWLDEIITQGMISTFTANGETFYQIKNFLKHQIINRPSRNVNPRPSETENETVTDQSVNDHGSITDESLNDHGTIIEQSLTEREREREREKDKSTLTGACAPACEAAPEKKPSKRKEACPVEAIVDEYHEVCSMLPAVTSWNGDGKKAMIARWNEGKDRQSVTWWHDFFCRVRDSDFLTGRVKDFRANLNWLVGRKNMEKVLNGAYDNRETALMPERLINNIRACNDFINGG